MLVNAAAMLAHLSVVLDLVYDPVVERLGQVLEVMVLWRWRILRIVRVVSLVNDAVDRLLLQGEFLFCGVSCFELLAVGNDVCILE